MNIDPLITTLLDLKHALTGEDFKLILGGGFGLYLKQIDRQNQVGIRTLIAGEFWPLPRATEDLDFFLPTEIVIDLKQMRALRAALDTLGFQPVEEAKFLHFSKPWDNGGRVKIDMLTGPIADSEHLKRLKITRPRVRPRGDLELHAYLANEALDFEKGLLQLSIEGALSSGQHATASVYIPQSFTFILMKLHAFSDRIDDVDRDLGRHHALDIYRIIAMLTPEEYADLLRNIDIHQMSRPVQRAREIVATAFNSMNAIGIVRLCEHSLFTTNMNPDPLIRMLTDIFLA